MTDEGQVPDPESRRQRKRRELTPTQRALGLLTRREHSQRELTRKLTARGVEPDDADAVVAKLREGGWQDDTRFAESLLRTRAFAGYGPVRLRAELATHGLEREMVAAIIDAYDGDWVENARDLTRRRYGADLAENLKRQRKAADLLYRRGFTSEQIRAAIRFDPDE